MTKTLTEQQIRKIIENGTGKAAKVCEKKFYGKPKSLTEQWREGTLPEGWYYLKVKSELANYPVIAECVINYSSLKPYSDFYEYDDNHVEEVLAPVPSYEELTLMSGNYRLAKKALRDCYNEMKYWATMNHRCSKIFNHIKAALVEIEEVK